jgi:hypothetical protein
MTDPANPTTPAVATDTFATLSQAQGGTWTLASLWCPTKATPIPDAGAIRDQVIKLLPTIPVGIVTGHLSLVNVQEILWTPTDASRDLGAIHVIGQPVRVRLTFDHADWDFGDSSTASSDQPGKVYHPDIPCATGQCPDYFGHTYTTTGPMKITMTATWAGQYSLDNGAHWTTITGGPLTGPTSTTTITVKQARAELINPDH